MTDLACRDEIAEGAKGFFKRYALVVIVNIAVSRAAKILDAAIGPVQLVKIDIIRLQIFKAAIDGADNLFAREASFLAVAQPDHRRAARDFCGDDSLRGEDGNDRLYGNDGADTLLGHDGADVLEGRNGDDFIKGDGGDDHIIGGAGADIIQGGSGVDTSDYRLSSAAVIIDLSSSGAQFGGDAAGDTLSEIEKVLGSAFNDQIIGDSNANGFDGGAGADDLRGGVGADSISGGSGDDSLRGDDGNDRLYGNDGADTLFGHDGADVLEGRDGNDLIKGDGGNDYLIGGNGADILVGGAGDDVFIIRVDGEDDIIADWSGGTGASDDISVQGFGTAFDTFAEIFGASSQSGSDVVIDLGGGDTVTLWNTQLADLHQDDFLFV